ncbi:MAG: divalent-cation tolerance protein CutA [Rhodospirillales bacterium]|nr:divalent-cation tolerance protein CutA [Rhodospirillales bacterium]
MTAMLVYVTVGTRKEALAIGRTLVEERLSPSANVLDGVHSIYWWQGKLNEGDEAVLILKSTRERLPMVIARAVELHSYDCPCVVALPIADGNPDYLAWIAAETSGAARG